MDTSLLEKIGLTKAEIEVYIALFRLGPTTITPIKNMIKVHPSKIYEYLNRLIRKGLVTYARKENAKYFQALNPESLNDFLDEKERDIKNLKEAIKPLIRELEVIQPISKEELNANIYEGFSGFKRLYDNIYGRVLSKGDTHYVIGAPLIANKRLEGFFVEGHKLRIKRDIKFKIIFNYDARAFAKKRAKLALTEAAYLPQENVVPAWVDVFGDYVATYFMTESTALAFVIKNKEIAKGYLKYFDVMWEKARKV
jgi:sugar-specific transcriptional regulator TrmB